MNPKQLRFVDEYMKDRNGTQAAIRAGYSLKSAKVTACRVLTNANVKVEISRRIDAYTRTAGIQVVDLLLEMKAIAFSDLRLLFDDNGRPLDPSIWPEEAAKAVAAFDVTGKRDAGPDGEPIRLTWKIRLHDKQKALFTLLDFLRPLNQAGQEPGDDIAAKIQIDAAKAGADSWAGLEDGLAKSPNAPDVGDY